MVVVGLGMGTLFLMSLMKASCPFASVMTNPFLMCLLSQQYQQFIVKATMSTQGVT
jgi:hypothetical protein